MGIDQPKSQEIDEGKDFLDTSEVRGLIEKKFPGEKFTELKKLYETPQSPDKHAEGTKLIDHLQTMMNEWKNVESNGEASEETKTFLRDPANKDLITDFILLHDIGKEKTAEYREIGSDKKAPPMLRSVYETKSLKEKESITIQNIGHEKGSVSILDEQKVPIDPELKRLIAQHMLPLGFTEVNTSLINKRTSKEAKEELKLTIEQLEKLGHLSFLDMAGTKRKDENGKKVSNFAQYKNYQASVKGVKDGLGNSTEASKEKRPEIPAQLKQLGGVLRDKMKAVASIYDSLQLLSIDDRIVKLREKGLDQGQIDKVIGTIK